MAFVRCFWGILFNMVMKVLRQLVIEFSRKGYDGIRSSGLNGPIGWSLLNG